MLLLGGALLFAAQRAILWRSYAGTPVPRAPFADPIVYLHLARTWAAGNPMPEQAVFHPPLYPYVVGLIFRAFGESMRAMIVVQNVVGVLAAVAILGAVIRIVARLRPILLTILILLQGGAWISYEWRLYPDSLSTNLQILALLGLWMVWAGREGPDSGPAPAPPGRDGARPLPAIARHALLALSGLLLGAAVLLRPNLVPVPPLLAAWSLLPAARARLGRWGIAYLLIVPALALAPFLVRNRALGAGWSPSANAGITFAQGNNAGAIGWYAALPGVSTDITLQNEDAVRIARRHGARTIAEADRYWLKQGLAWWRDNPGRGLALVAKKAFLFFGPREIGGDMSFEFLKARLPALRASALVNFLFVAFFTLFAAVPLRRWRFPVIPAAAFVGVTFLTCAVFYMGNRYRLPVWPVLSIAAALGLDHVIAAWRRTAPRGHGGLPRFVYGLALLAGAAIVIGTIPIRTPWYTQLADWHNWGVMAERANMLPEAERAYRQALRIAPTHRETLENLGYDLLLAERYAEAEEALTTLVRAHPASSRGQARMALVRLARGDAAGAEAFARRALSLAPDDETARRALEEALRIRAEAGN